MSVFPLDSEAEGEFLSIDERLVVSPQWGRFHGEPLGEGGHVAAGDVLGSVTQGRDERLLHAPAAAILLQWLVREGQWVRPGMPLVRLHPEEE